MGEYKPFENSRIWDWKLGDVRLMTSNKTLLKSIFYKKIHKYLVGGKSFHDLTPVSALLKGVIFANFCLHLHQIFMYFLIKKGL